MDGDPRALVAEVSGCVQGDEWDNGTVNHVASGKWNSGVDQRGDSRNEGRGLKSEREIQVSQSGSDAIVQQPVAKAGLGRIERSTYVVELTAEELSATIEAFNVADRVEVGRPPLKHGSIVSGAGKTAWRKFVDAEAGR